MSEGDVPEAGIAVVGMSGRFPGCRGAGGSAVLAAFWHLLRDGGEAITFFSEAELAAAGVSPELIRDPRYVPARGVLEDAEGFDADFFGVPPREAELLDPQHRLVLECAWEALEDAGRDPARATGPVGVFVGAGPAPGRDADADSAPADALERRLAAGRDFLATRVSYKLDLKGPSLTVETACSTSLVAVHLACQSLLAGECDLALAGGASVRVPEVRGYLYQEGGIASPDGRCRAFDAGARGTVGGSGVGVVVLKRLGEALADGDRVRAVVLGSATNNDGAAKVGFAAPGVGGQAAVVAEALAVAEVDPATVGYVEAHGTGTPLGDAVEVAALKEAFGGGDRQYCALGSLKTNIGHLDAAAGVAGLIKTVLALEHREIPPSLHCEVPHPRIEFGATPFYVNTVLRPWRPRGEAPRRAGVSSFGIGGTNAHVVLEEAPPPAPRSRRRRPQLLVLSARTPEALDAATRRLAAHLEEVAAGPGEPDLGGVAYTLQVGRRAFAERRFVRASDPADARRGLLDSGRRVTARRPAGEAPEVVFLFPGQGTAPGAHREPYERCPAFRREIDGGAEHLAAHLRLDLRDLLYPAAGDEEKASAQLARPSLGQPALLLVELALARLWLAWGVAPRALLGHSVGEYAAACLAGVLEPRAALALVAERGRLTEGLPAGAMLSVALPARQLAARLGGDVTIAAFNAPRRTVVAGPPAAVRDLAAELAASGVASRRLPVSRAYHSPAMEGAVTDFAVALAEVVLRPPRTTWVSSLTGCPVSAAEATDPDYWLRQLCEPVRFADAVAALAGESESPFLLEVGPGRSLAALARQCGSAPGRRAASLPDVLDALGRLWLAGAEVDWQAVHGPERPRRVALPTYPFERRQFSSGPRPAETAGKRPDVATWFYLPGWKLAPPLPAASAARDWLLFLDDGPWGAALAERLTARGGTVTAVRRGPAFRRLGPASYVVDPRARVDYRRLFAALRDAGTLPRTLVHLWNLRGGAPEPDPPAEELDAETIDRRLVEGFDSLLAIAGAFAAEVPDGPLEIVVVGDRLHAVTGGEELCPARTTLLGPCRVIPQEQPRLACRTVDARPAAAALPAADRLLDRLADELAGGAGPPAVALRGPQRWLPEPTAVRLDRPPGLPPRLRRHGVYLITGGLGRVGLAAAELLARTAAARLVLVGRRVTPPRAEWPRWRADHGDGDPDSRRIRRLEALEELGAEVLVLAADASREEDMRRILARAEERFGPLHGVLHAAGCTDPDAFPPVAGTTREVAGRHFRPKVSATLVLERALRGRTLDFCLLVSSLSTWLGGVGFSAYAAANHFVGAFAHVQDRRGATPWISVDWDGWRFDSGARRRAGSAAPAMTEAEGQETLARLLASELTGRVAVSTAELVERMERARRSGAPRPPAEAGRPEAARPALATSFVAPRNALERRLAEVWSEVLGIDPVGVNDDLYELGGDSLHALRILARLPDRCGVELPASKFFAVTTVSELAAAVAPGGTAPDVGAEPRRAAVLEEGSL